ncbi:hypothetical protein JCM17380_47590 [Desulfosporosinus burensis]
MMKGSRIIFGVKLDSLYFTLWDCIRGCSEEQYLKQKGVDFFYLRKVRESHSRLPALQDEIAKARL